MRIGINGFGRIGRNFTKALLERYPDVEIAAVNDLTSAAECAHLFKYDSNYGTFAGEVSASADAITIDGRTIKVLAERDPGQAAVARPRRRRRRRVDRHLHRRRQGARAHRRRRREESHHLRAGQGRGHHDRARRQRRQATTPRSTTIISNASCTTNCLATAVKPIVDRLGWVKGFMSTIHSYTNDQNILDAPHKDWRRARNAATNIIPTSTGAAKALYLTIPEVEGHLRRVRAARADADRLDGVPRRADEESDDARRAQRDPARRGAGRLARVRRVHRGRARLERLQAQPAQLDHRRQADQREGDLIQIAAWYDNEWGYSCRLADLTRMVGAKIPASVA